MKMITMDEYEEDPQAWDHIEYWDAREDEQIPYGTIYEALQLYCELRDEPTKPGEALTISGLELDPRRNDEGSDMEEDALREVVVVAIPDLYAWLAKHWPDEVDQ
jgi:hypothetical protein